MRKWILGFFIFLGLTSVSFAEFPYSVEFDTPTAPTKIYQRMAGEILIGATTTNYVVKISSYEVDCGGLLLEGATIYAANIQAGSLPSDVIASSIAVNAVLDNSIVSLSPSKISAGSLDSDVICSSIAVNSVLDDSIISISPSKISAGSLDSDVIASSIAVNAVLDVSIVSVTPAKISAGSLDSDVICSSIAVSAVLDDSIVSVTPSKLSAGSLDADVIASSIAVAAVGIPQINATGSPGAATYLAGDGSWDTPSGAGDMLLASTQTVTATKNYIGSAEVITDYGFYHKRTPEANADWTSFTVDGTTHTVDASSIVPVGTKAVQIGCYITDASITANVGMSVGGNPDQIFSNTLWNMPTLNGAIHYEYGVIGINSDRLIYYSFGTAISNAGIVIMGWWK